MNKPLDGNLGRYQIVSLIARGGMAEVYIVFLSLIEFPRKFWFVPQEEVHDDV